MPASLESASISVWQLLALAALVVATVAGSVYLARKHLASDPGLPDAAFWDGFAGLAVVLGTGRVLDELGLLREIALQ